MTPITDDDFYTQSQAVRYLSNHITKNGNIDHFENDLGLLLSENRRARRSNVSRYGKVPFETNSKGRVFYSETSLKELAARIDKVATERKERARLRMLSALTRGRKYAT